MSSPNYSTASSYSSSQNQNYSPQAAMVTAQSHYHSHPFGPLYRQYDKTATFADTVSSELTSPTNIGVHDARPVVVATTANAKQSESPQLSPVFKSEAAKQIIKEMTEKKVEGPRRRQIPREKRRHYTVSSSKPVLDLEDTFSKMVLFVSFNFRSFFLFLSHFPIFVYLYFALSFVLHLFISLYHTRRFENCELV